ncbi:MAG: hypothetical protein PHT97_11405 [Methanoculleus sp.]|uniref:hypothetical protein n=1 Tax=Methanoculleus sp. TaxID=90427 RepID=UPI0026193026|nr:hypothetical protein [Methanoculleus sp.]MDD2259268.1 hypothetical protein [Bacilli bacterium]MDD4471750.1 hypothetical protein [Methanoculleus sp.]
MIDAIAQVVIMASGTALGGLMVYTAVQVRRIYITLQKHDRMIFGEEGVDGWMGLLKLALNDSRCTRELVDIVDGMLTIVARNPDDQCRDKIGELRERIKALKRT